ncbi:MAG: DegT/DnrJ/EryC1/StrS family aminotransferase [Salinisphaera sp.]|jgi:dTDP-4-amino-4,6-dideoxygalactose transaminase|nr:DegT/DnrJ/EryC1/StrS family aminotransferase [Salinisphaera sp.]
MQEQPFKGDFTRQEPIAEDAISAAVNVMRSGRLHRYNTPSDTASYASELEAAFAHYTNKSYCLACTSGGYAMHVALRAAGLKPGETVLTNAFTLAPVPGAIVNASGVPVFVESTVDLVIDLDDLEDKLSSTGARWLLLSHMRGHMVDMDALTTLLSRFEANLIEDCAHTMGSRWNDSMSGTFGLAGCFSTQTYKHMNSGEGGLIVSDDARFMAKAILLSGSYMLYERHGAAPDQEIFDGLWLDTPNLSGRMDDLRAAILLPQLASLQENIDRWNERYMAVEAGLKNDRFIAMPKRPDAEHFVGSSIQFRIPTFTADQCTEFVRRCADLGVELKWFGRDKPVGYTSTHHHWGYTPGGVLPRTDRILARLFDMRIPLTFSVSDCDRISRIILFVLTRMRHPQAAD